MLCAGREVGHHKIIVRRNNLLEDSTAKFMSKKPADVRTQLHLFSRNRIQPHSTDRLNI